MGKNTGKIVSIFWCTFSWLCVQRLSMGRHAPPYLLLSLSLFFSLSFSFSFSFSFFLSFSLSLSLSFSLSLSLSATYLIPHFSLLFPSFSCPKSINQPPLSFFFLFVVFTVLSFSQYLCMSSGGRQAVRCSGDHHHLHHQHNQFKIVHLVPFFTTAVRQLTILLICAQLFFLLGDRQN